MVDRQFAYTGAIPQDTDILSSEKNALYGIGHLAQAALGTGTCVVGLVGAQSTVPDLHISIGAGAIYSAQPVDATAYGDLGTDSNTIVKQGLLKTPQVLTLTPPGTTGYSQVYLVQAAYQDVDGGATVLPYFNSSNPSAPYAGPANAGTSNYTVRQGVCAITLKAGAAAPTGSQTAPSTDAGYVPLYTITLANGQTAITTSQIVKASAAPFVPCNLNTALPLAGGTMTGPLKAPAGFFTGMVIISGATALTEAESGLFIELLGSSPFTLTLPTITDGANVRYTGFVAANTVTLSTPVNNIDINLSYAPTFVLPTGTYFDVWFDGGNWVGVACGPGIYAQTVPLANRDFTTSSVTSQTLPNNTVTQYVNFSTGSASFGSMSASAFTVSVAGVYAISGAISATLNFTGTGNIAASTTIYKNGVAVPNGSTQVGNYGSSPESANCLVSRVLTLAAGDVISIWGFGQSSAPTSAAMTSATLSITRLF